MTPPIRPTQNLGIFTLTAAVALLQFRLLRINSSGQAVYAAAGQRAIGRAADKTDPGDTVAVEPNTGRFLAQASENISRGAEVACGPNGTVVNATGTFAPAIGIAEFAATVSGTNFPIIGVTAFSP